MATTLSAAIKPYRTETASAVPLAANMEVGEIAVNVTDKIIYMKTSAGSVVQVAGASSIDPLPSQTGHNGKFLTTDGTNASWSAISQVPSQTSHSGKYLTTNGTTASWSAISEVPSQATHSGKFLTTDGSTASWQAISEVPSQTGNSGKFLYTNGTAASWATPDAGGYLNVDYQEFVITHPLTPAGSTATILTNFQVLDMTSQYELVVLCASTAGMGCGAFVYDKTNRTVGSYTLIRSAAISGARNLRCARLSNTTALVITSVSTAMEGVVVTLSGTTISVGTAATYTTTATASTFRGFIGRSASTFILSYRNGSNYMRLLAFTVSGTTVTIGTETNCSVAATAAEGGSIIDVDGTHFLICYASTTQFNADPFTVSGTTITVGTAATNAATAAVCRLAKLTTNSRGVVMFRNTTTYAGVVSVAANVATLSSANTTRTDADGHFIVPFADYAICIIPQTSSAETNIVVLRDSAGTASVSTSFYLAYMGSSGSAAFPKDLIPIKKTSTGVVLWGTTNQYSAMAEISVASYTATIEYAKYWMFNSSSAPQQAISNNYYTAANFDHSTLFIPWLVSNSTGTKVMALTNSASSQGLYVDLTDKNLKITPMGSLMGWTRFNSTTGYPPAATRVESYQADPGYNAGGAWSCYIDSSGNISKFTAGRTGVY